DDALFESADVQNGIRSVNWLTCIDDSLIARLGGIEALRAGATGDLHLHEYPGGAIIRAGDFPQAGDRNRQITIEPYRHAAALLRPVQIEAARNGEMLGFDEESTRDWVNRFNLCIDQAPRRPANRFTSTRSCASTSTARASCWRCFDRHAWKALARTHSTICGRVPRQTSMRCRSTHVRPSTPRSARSLKIPTQGRSPRCYSPSAG